MNRNCPNCKNDFYSVEIDTQGCPHCGWPCSPRQIIVEPDRTSDGVEEGAYADDDIEDYSNASKNRAAASNTFI